MAHLILKHDKQQATFQAWHGKTIIKKDISLNDNWLREWDIVQKPLYFEDGLKSDFDMIECNDNDSIKIGAPFNRESYKPLSNKDFLKLVEDSIAGSNHEVVSVGSYRNRGRVSISLKLAGMEDFKAAGRQFGAYLNFGNGHDKSSVLWANTSNICTVCDNTFSFNLFQRVTGDNVNLKQRHTKNAKLKLPAMADLIQKAIGEQTRFKLELENLAKNPCNLDLAKCWFAGFQTEAVKIEHAERTKEKTGIVFSTRSLNMQNRIGELFETGKGNAGNDYADLFSAITDYYSHESSGGEKSIQRQIESSEIGNGNVNKQRAFTLLSNSVSRDSILDHGKRMLEIHHA